MTRLRLAVALLLVGGMLAACGSSPEDEARDDGETIGEDVRAVADSGSIDEARTAITKLREDVGNLDPDVRERVQSQVDTQRDTISRAVEMATETADPEEAKLELRGAAQDLAAQADSFRSSNNSIANEFWRGFEDGYNGD